MVSLMKLKARCLLHWRRYGLTERVFVLLPLLILTPRWLDHLSGGHNGEPSQEFVITLVMFGMLILLGVEARRNPALRVYRDGQSIWLLLAIASIALWSAASLWWTTDVGATQDHTVLWLNYTALILVGRLVLRRRSMMGLSALLLTAGCAVALFHFAQYWQAGTGRPLASPIYANLGVTPEILVTLLPLFFGVHLTVRRPGLAWGSLLMTAVVWIGSLSTYQRAPLLASCMALSLLALGLFAKWIVPRTRLRVVALAITLILTGSFQMSLPAKVQDPLGQQTGKEFVVQQIKGIRTMEVDTSSRLQFWATALEMALAHPVLGVGAGAYKTNYVAYRRVANAHPYWGRVKDFSQLEGMDYVYRAHNEFMEILGELGFPGLLLMSALVFVLTRLLWLTPRPQRWLAVSVGAGALAFFVSSGFTSYSFRWIPCGFTFFLLMTLIIPAQRTAARRANIVLSLRYGRGVVLAGTLLLFLGVARTGQVMWSQSHQLQAQAALEDERRLTLYQKALAIDPYNFSASAEFGSLLYRSNRPQEAIAYLEAGVRHGINNISQHALLAFAYAQSGQPARSCEILQRVVEAYPGTLFARALYAEALTKEGNLSGAQEQRAVMHAINAGEAEVWQLILQHGLKTATLTAHQQKLPHPATLQPKIGLGVLQERQRLAQGQ
jgi:hypothetical protein